MSLSIAGCEIALHAAAVKHVFLCEESPFAAIHANILGTQNIIDAALRTGVERLLLTSSDKAVNPTNVMGTSKLMAERLVSAANAHPRLGNQIFASTRFGNVLGSRGSVIPLFIRQIRLGGPVTVTSPDMTRFIMTLDEAVGLVMDSLFLARGGEIFVTKMPVLRIGDLAEVMIEELAPQLWLSPERYSHRDHRAATGREDVRRADERGGDPALDRAAEIFCCSAGNFAKFPQDRLRLPGDESSGRRTALTTARTPARCRRTSLESICAVIRPYCRPVDERPM